MADEDLGYGDANAAAAQLPPGGRRRERKGSLAFISDNLPNMPSMPKIPSLLIPTMPALPNMPQMPQMPSMNPFAQRQTHEECSHSESDASSLKNSRSKSSDDDSQSESSEIETDSGVSRNESVPIETTRVETTRTSGEVSASRGDPDESEDTSSSSSDELENGKPRITTVETRNVRRLRRIFILTLIGVAGTVSFFTNKIVKSDGNTSTTPIFYTSMVASMFFVVLFLFCTFNFAVERRHRILKKATRQASTSTNILANVSPDKNIRREVDDMEKAPQRLTQDEGKDLARHDDEYSGKYQTLVDAVDQTNEDPTEYTADNRGSPDNDDTEAFSDDATQLSKSQGHNPRIKEPAKAQLKSILHDGDQSDQNQSLGFHGLTISDKSPCADLFLNCTVLFADIVNFNAWSRYVFSKKSSSCDGRLSSHKRSFVPTKFSRTYPGFHSSRGCIPRV
jgi:hypothetical protein